MPGSLPGNEPVPAPPTVTEANLAGQLLPGGRDCLPHPSRMASISLGERRRAAAWDGTRLAKRRVRRGLGTSPEGLSVSVSFFTRKCLMTTRTTLLRPLVSLLSFGLGLAALAGCGDGDTGTSGTTTTTTDTGSGGVGGTGGTGGSTGGVGGTGGTTTTDDTPVWQLEKIGNPMWEPVDYHQIAYDAGVDYEGLDAPLLALLPPPDHAEHADLFIGPGAAHDGPYDKEFAEGIAATGQKDRTHFTLAETEPNHVFVEMYMVVPSAGAPTGKTPDAAAGPMIPNSLFPIHITDSADLNAEPWADYVWETDVPALDAALNPPFDVEGHSHFPMFSIGTMDAGPGTVVQHLTMTDTEGNGWKITMTLVAE